MYALMMATLTKPIISYFLTNLNTQNNRSFFEFTINKSINSFPYWSHKVSKTNS